MESDSTDSAVYTRLTPKVADLVYKIEGVSSVFCLSCAVFAPVLATIAVAIERVPL